MGMVTVTCPRCGFSRHLERDAIPGGTERGSCPRCREGFSLAENMREWEHDIGGEAPGRAAQASQPAGEGLLTVSCPQCRFSREVPDGAIPEGATVTCPRCAARFTFAREDAGILSAAPPVQEPAAGPPPGEGMAPPTPPTAGAERARSASPRTLRFSFTGTAREYFGIWIVNILLKIVTLGVYSAWAKVRKRRYFFGNTMLHGAPFDYVADPLALFRGWLIGVVAFALYSVGTRFSPTLASVSGIVFFLAVPWLVVRSRLFNSRNSTYRNIRFNFRVNYREAYVVFAGLYLLVPFTLGLIIPYVIYRQKKFLMEQSEYGRTPVIFEGTAKDFYRLYLKAVGCFVALAAVVLPAMVFLFPTLLQGGASLAGADPRAAARFAFVPILTVALLYFVIVTYVQTAQANLVWNATRIGGSRFVSSLRVRDMAWLYLSNAAAIFFSLGLLTPWASVRLAHYRMENLTVSSGDDLEGFVAASQVEIDATGEEIGDLFGIDVAL